MTLIGLTAHDVDALADWVNATDEQRAEWHTYRRRVLYVLWIMLGLFVVWVLASWFGPSPTVAVTTKPCCPCDDFVTTFYPS